MTTRDAGALVRRMQECFNTRQFDEAKELFAPDFFSHALGTTGFETGTLAYARRPLSRLSRCRRGHAG